MMYYAISAAAFNMHHLPLYILALAKKREEKSSLGRVVNMQPKIGGTPMVEAAALTNKPSPIVPSGAPERDCTAAKGTELVMCSLERTHDSDATSA